jgi:hypothetical protein
MRVNQDAAGHYARCREFIPFHEKGVECHLYPNYFFISLNILLQSWVKNEANGYFY